MRRIAFPRLYVPAEGPVEPAELPPVTVEVTYRGERSQFGPVTVRRVGYQREIVGVRGRYDDGVELAAALLRDSQFVQPEPECCAAFAREVLAQLSPDSWELPMSRISSWYRNWRSREEAARWSYPPESDPDEELPGREEDERMSELVRRLGERLER